MKTEMILDFHFPLLKIFSSQRRSNSLSALSSVIFLLKCGRHGLELEPGKGLRFGAFVVGIEWLVGACVVGIGRVVGAAVVGIGRAVVALVVVVVGGSVVTYTPPSYSVKYGHSVAVDACPGSQFMQLQR